MKKCLILMGMIAMAMSMLGDDDSRLERPDNQGFSHVWGEITDGFCLSVCSTNAYVSAGHPVWVTVRVKNLSGEERRWVVTSPEKEYVFNVKDADGNDVPRLRYQLRLQEDTEVPRRVVKALAPNQMIEHEINLCRHFDFSLAGEYSLQATRNTLNASGNGMVKLVSNIETISIR